MSSSPKDRPARPSHHDLRASVDRYRAHNEEVRARQALDPAVVKFDLETLGRRATVRGHCRKIARILLSRMLSGGPIAVDQRRCVEELIFAALCYARTEPTELESTDDLRGAAIDFARAFGEVVK